MEEKRKKNGKPKQVGNGNGSLYFSEKLQKWIYQYVEPNGKRQTMTQRKNESYTMFKKRVTEVQSKLDKGTYIAKTTITVYSLGLELIENKFKRNKISEVSYNRELKTLHHIKNSDISNIKIQQIKPYYIQKFIDSKKSYSNGYIDKFYELLGRIFNEALKRDYIIKNPMLNVEKPKSEKEDKKVESFSIEEQQAFLNQLTVKEKYKDIIK